MLEFYVAMELYIGVSRRGALVFIFFFINLANNLVNVFYFFLNWLITNLLQCLVKALHETAAEMTLRLHHLSDTVDNYVRFIMRKLEAVKTDLENLVMISEFYVCCLYNSKASFLILLQNSIQPLIFNFDIPNIICLNILKHPVWQIDINNSDYDSYGPDFDMFG